MRPLGDLFRITGFTAHASCISSPEIIRQHITGDALTATAYFAIPLALFVFIIRQGGKFPFNRVTFFCGLFVLFCGLSHVMAIVVLRDPYYVLEGWIKIATGVVSWAALMQLVPALRTILSAGTEERSNLALIQELAGLKARFTTSRKRDVMKAFRLRTLARELAYYAEAMDVEVSDLPSGRDTAEP